MKFILRPWQQLSIVFVGWVQEDRAGQKVPLTNSRDPCTIKCVPNLKVTHGGGAMYLKKDEGLKAFIDSAKEKGYLTYSQVNEYLPDDAVNPEKLDRLLMILEEHGIELIDLSEAGEREAEPSASPDLGREGSTSDPKIERRNNLAIMR